MPSPIRRLSAGGIATRGERFPMNATVLSEAEEAADNLMTVKFGLQHCVTNAEQCRKLVTIYRDAVANGLVTDFNSHRLRTLEVIALGIESGVRMLKRLIDDAEKNLNRASEAVFEYDHQAHNGAVESVLILARQQAVRFFEQSTEAAKKGLNVRLSIEETIADFTKQLPTLRDS
jgi:hypothetical protein